MENKTKPTPEVEEQQETPPFQPLPPIPNDPEIKGRIVPNTDILEWLKKNDAGFGSDRVVRHTDENFKKRSSK